MKRLIIGTLSLLLISTASTSVVRAEKAAYEPGASGKTPSYIARITPFNLVNLAYQGDLERQGIPSYQDFILAYQAKQISAEDIVRSGVQSKRLPSQVLADKEYINAVRNQLENFKGIQNY